ncbi:MAG: BamA/TamA family outer membrane protein, partial [Thermodesulfobacteriota bacterium]
PNSAQSIRDMIGTHLTSGITVYIQRDTRNRMFNPSEGSDNSFTITYIGGPFSGDYHYTKYIANSAWYIPTGLEETTILARGKLGYITENQTGGLPVWDKFQLGGMHSLRGFRWGQVSPKDPVTGEYIGGEKMALFNFELVFPLIKETGFMGVIFYDTGNVWTEAQDYDFGDMRMSYGGGIRFYSPMGPLRLEYGKIIDRRAGEPEENWEFSMGTLF